MKWQPNQNPNINACAAGVLTVIRALLMRKPERPAPLTKTKIAAAGAGLNWVKKLSAQEALLSLKT